MRYLIVGGGVGGLAAAHFLVERHGVSGADVRVLEATDRVGGCLKPATLAGQTLDAGPDALLTRRSEGVELLDALDLEGRTVRPASGRAYLASASGLAPYPPGLFLGVPIRPESVANADVLSPAGRARGVEGFELPPATRADDVSVSEMVARRWGEEVAQRLAGPLIAAVHAGDANYLSAAACAPQLFPDARPSLPKGTGAAPESPFVSLDGGLWQLAEELRRVLEDRGVEVSTGAAVHELEQRPDGWMATTPAGEVGSDRVVLAVGAPVAARLLAPVAPTSARSLASMEHASVAIAIVLLSPAADFPEGSGFLVPPTGGSQRYLTACTWFDQKWPGTARPDGRIVRLSTGRHGDARFEELDDAELTGRLVDDLAELTGQRLEALSATVTRFPDAFPQYAVGHVDRIAAVHGEVNRATAGGLALCGNAYAGVGLPAVIGSARTAAAVIAPAT